MISNVLIPIEADIKRFWNQFKIMYILGLISIVLGIVVANRVPRISACSSIFGIELVFIGDTPFFAAIRDVQQ